MRTRYDPQADAVSVRLSDTPVVESEAVRPGLVVDFDAAGRTVGFDILGARENLPKGTDLPKAFAA